MSTNVDTPERLPPSTSSSIGTCSASRWGPRPLRGYQDLADQHVPPLIGEERAGRLDGEIVGSLYAELRRCRIHCRGSRRLIDHRTTHERECDHRCASHRCRPLSASTVRQVHYVLSGAYKNAVRWGWVSVSPIDHSDAPPQPQPNPQPPSPEEAAAILNRAWHDDPDWGTHIWIAMVNGSRRGETCAIRWSHIDLENRVLHLEKAIAQIGAEIWEKDTKTHQDRRIVLDEQTADLLTE
ncbi:MAG: site-specific integrase, partial [Haloechinothrix sp.]